MKVRIKRQDDRRSAPYWQVFHFRGEGRITVAAILEKLNERDQLEDIKGKQCRKIRWECGCMQKMCGGCAMVINGHPALACGVFINTDDTEILRLEPLTKFPVVEDLIVDRSVIWERQKEALMYLGIRKHPDPKEHDHQYSAAKCLKYGLKFIYEYRGTADLAEVLKYVEENEGKVTLMTTSDKVKTSFDKKLAKDESSVK